MKAKTLFSVFFRTLFLEATWNYRGMQNLGLLFCMLPGLKNVYKNTIPKDILCNYAGFFNTHPFMSSYIIGALMKEEENSLQKDKLERFKDISSRMLGSIGDRLFWKYLKPIMAVLAGVVIVLCRFEHPVYAAAGILLSLAVFNWVAIYIRISGLRKGYLHGREIIRILKDIHLEKRIEWIIVTGSFTIGFFISLTGGYLYSENHYSFLIFPPLILICYLINNKKLFPGFSIVIPYFSVFLISLLFETIF